MFMIVLLPPKEFLRLPAQANRSPETTQANGDDRGHQTYIS